MSKSNDRFSANDASPQRDVALDTKEGYCYGNRVHMLYANCQEQVPPWQHLKIVHEVNARNK